MLSLQIPTFRAFDRRLRFSFRISIGFVHAITNELEMKIIEINEFFLKV